MELNKKQKEKILINPLVEIMSKIERFGFDVFLVGGSVRDVLLGKKPDDFDLATNATPDEVKDIFPDSHFEIGNSCGTIGVIKNDIIFEITTFRNEVYNNDNSRVPSVSFAKTLKEDLHRRDFTINAIAINKDGVIAEESLCFLDDLKNKRLKTTSEANKIFSEDPLRILRAIRFGMEMTVDLSVIEAMISQRERLSIVSMERIRKELDKIIKAGHLKSLVKILNDFKIMEIIFPFLNSKMIVKSIADFDSKTSILDPNFIIFEFYVALLLRYQDVEKMEDFLPKLKFSKNERKLILQIIKTVNSDFSFVDLLKLKELAVISLKSREGRLFKDQNLLWTIFVSNLFLLHKDPKSPEAIKKLNSIKKKFNTKLVLKKDITFPMEKLVELGYKGKEIGEMVKKIQKAIFDELIENDYLEILNFVIENTILNEQSNLLGMLNFLSW